MSENKWTPGPWKVDREPADSICTSGFKTALKAAQVPAVIVQSFGTCFALGVDVAAVPSYGGEMVARANAHLIAAAPLMAEALAPFAALAQPELALRSDSDPLYGIGTSEPITVGDVRRVVAALRAARGTP